MSIIQCDSKFDFLFYDIKVQLFPENHTISGQVEFSIRNLVDNTKSITLTLLSTLEVSRLTTHGDDLTYERNGRHELTIHLKKTLNEGDEQTFRIDYSGEMIAHRGYDGYVGEEGIFMRPFAAWYPYGTGNYGWYDFPDVPYVLEARAPLGWTLFAHPDSPQVEQEADQVVYRWDGRQPHQRRPAPWGIALFGGKYHKIERKIGEHSITFFALGKSDRRMEKIISNLSELWSKLDEFSNMPSSPRQIRLAEHADSLVMTHQPAHISFFPSKSFNSLWDMTWSSIWDDVYGWEALSEANWLEPLDDELAFHLRQWFFADDDRSPEGWLVADLERLLRAYSGAIQTKVYLKLTWGVRGTKGAWAWWMWRKMIGDEAFSRAIYRLRAGAFPKDTVIGSKEFFALTSDEAGIPSDWFWEQWIEQTSAPLITFERVSVEERPGGFMVDIVLSQPGDVYHLPLDIVLRTNEEEVCQPIFMNERTHHLAFHCKGKPEILEIEPRAKNYEVAIR